MFPKKLTRQPICNMDEPVASTPCGKLRGRQVEDTYIFRGIRYAEAARFHMPEKVKPWDGIREAVVLGPVCCETGNSVPYDEALIPHYFYPQDENCQYLNIWTQQLDPHAKKPVMVWIHGGGFNSGSSCEQFAYDGENLSKFGDTVVVSLNHRLNLLGFLNLSKYGECYRYSGNLGITDIVMALEWIRDNIGAFGGDPGNVTLLGQSGGGAKITTLLQAPAADGLFHKAVITSGVIGKEDTTVEESQRFADMMLAELGISQTNIGEIERVPYYKLARAAACASDKLHGECGMSFMWGPVYDSEYYFGNPLFVDFRRESNNIPIILGSTLSEFSNNYSTAPAPGSKNGWAEELKGELFRGRYGENAERIVAAFTQAYPRRNTADALFVDRTVRSATLDFARRRAQPGFAPLYNFLFCLEGPINGGTLPWHGADLPFIFHNAEHIPTAFIPGVSEKLQDIMSGACVAFARTGDPNHAELPSWEPVQPGGDATMIFDTETEMRYDHDRALIELLPHVSFDSITSGRPKPVLGGGPRQSL